MGTSSSPGIRGIRGSWSIGRIGNLGSKDLRDKRDGASVRIVLRNISPEVEWEERLVGVGMKWNEEAPEKSCL